MTANTATVITGRNFGTMPALDALITVEARHPTESDVACTNVTRVSATELRCTNPIAGAPGLATGRVMVVTIGGQNYRQESNGVELVYPDDREKLDSCPPGQELTADRFACVPCAKGEFSSVNTTAPGGCAACPKLSALCAELGTTIPLPTAGFYRGGAPSSLAVPEVATDDDDGAGVPFYACPEPDAQLKCPGFGAPPSAHANVTRIEQALALGAETCGAGYTGPLCQVCEDGHRMRGGRCTPCEASEAGTLTATLVLQVLGAGVFLTVAVLQLRRTAQHAKRGREAQGKAGAAAVAGADGALQSPSVQGDVPDVPDFDVQAGCCGCGGGGSCGGSVCGGGPGCASGPCGGCSSGPCAPCGTALGCGQ